MTDLATSTVETYITGLVTDVGGVAAAIIAVTVALGLGVYLVFWGLNKIKGGLG
jgi:peroxiredoxin family protein